MKLCQCKYLAQEKVRVMEYISIYKISIIQWPKVFNEATFCEMLLLSLLDTFYLHQTLLQDKRKSISVPDKQNQSFAM